MNQYIYAPKDDPYHNVKWRELYPDIKLKELEKLAKLAQRKNIDFVWAIHPGQNLIDFSIAFFDSFFCTLNWLFDLYLTLLLILFTIYYII
ncbi:MAG: beta-N-acetylglucosaminidase domain-containing protein, partial [Clostridium baratii]|nr:beta-N-acetylglucosaminidase domain-containing protein [Clostridium baratii]